jgi:hypothetical protein
MAEPKPFARVKLICGIIANRSDVFARAEELLAERWGPIDDRSPRFEFNWTDYYERQMGPGLKRCFLSFERLINPEEISEIKLATNELEEKIKAEVASSRRIVNLDPGYLTPAALVMATLKNFAHRIPLKKGVYAHLELLLGRQGVRLLEWTYPDFRSPTYHEFFLKVRHRLMEQLASKAE